MSVWVLADSRGGACEVAVPFERGRPRALCQICQGMGISHLDAVGVGGDVTVGA